jgi:hypothetical protein
VLTEETVAAKLAVEAPAATVTVDGIVTSELLLERFTVNPPLAAAAFNVTVQLSVPEPTIDELAQLSPVNTGTPVPLRLTAVDDPASELLVNVIWPVAEPAAVGLNCTLSVAVWPGASVTGRPSPEMEKLLPNSAAALTVTGAVPVEDRVSGCVTAEFTGTLPKARLEALIPSVGIAAPSCRSNASATPPTLAVNVAACTEVTGETFAVNWALVEPAAMVTEAGTTTALLLLVRLTPRPLSAAAFSVTLQLSVPAPVIAPLAQVSPLSTGTPMPLRATEAEDPFAALLVTVNWPVAAPDDAGSNLMVNVRLPLAATAIGMLLPPLMAKNCPVKFSSEISTGADPWFKSVMFVLAVLPTATWPKSTVLDDTVSVPVVA